MQMEYIGRCKKTLQFWMIMKYIFPLIILLFAALFSISAMAGVNMDSSGPMGLPFSSNMGRKTEVDTSICPAGARTVTNFLKAWKKDDFPAMYDLLTDESKQKYPYDQMRFTFQFLEYREYEIISIRKNGDNFDFIIGAGDWKEGNKDNKKLIIDGKSFKIIMQSMNSPFKESAASHF